MNISDEQKKASVYLGDGAYYHLDEHCNAFLWTERYEDERMVTHVVALEPEHVLALYRAVDQRMKAKR